MNHGVCLFHLYSFIPYELLSWHLSNKIFSLWYISRNVQIVKKNLCRSSRQNSLFELYLIHSSENGNTGNYLLRIMMPKLYVHDCMTMHFPSKNNSNYYSCRLHECKQFFVCLFVCRLNQKCWTHCTNMQNFNMSVETTLVLQSICTFIVCL